MIGIPKVFNTKADWMNAHEYAFKSGDDEYKKEMIKLLEGLKDSRFMLVLKQGVTKPPEEHTPEDYEQVEDPGSELLRLGFTIPEIDLLISRLQ